MNILTARHNTKSTAQAVSSLVASVGVYFWWYSFGYFSQKSGIAS